MIEGVLPNDIRHDQMAKAIKRFPMMKKKHHWSSRWLSIACYGPSLADTWHEIQGPLMTVSGAHDFMVSRGTIPDWHVDCDPREHKVRMLKQPQDATKYLMASCCHTAFWNALKGRNVKLWHLVNGDDLITPKWIRENHPEGIAAMLGGGSTVGMRALEVGAALGFRRFKFYGMDCSFEYSTHAGAHLGKRQDEIMVQVGGTKYRTSPQLLQQAQEMERFILSQNADLEFHGNGLMQHTARLLNERKAA